MWFNPAELLENKTTPLANCANSANYETGNREEALPISRLAGLAEGTNSENIEWGDYTETENHEEASKLAGLAGLAEGTNQKFVNCGQCLYFQCHSSHGKGSGLCSIGGDYGLWSETAHQCTKFIAAVECRDYTEPDIKNPLTVICYTPAGNPVKVTAKDEAHKAFLLRTNPAPRN
jgi:hypothetical protein